MLNLIDDFRESLQCCLPLVDADVGLGVSIRTLSIELQIGSGRALGGLGGASMSVSGKVLHVDLVDLDGGHSQFLNTFISAVVNHKSILFIW